MINHARNLLLNRCDSGQYPWDFPGEEYVPPTFVRKLLPQWLNRGMQILFGSDPDRLFLNHRLRQVMPLLHATELEDYVLALDSRITYWPLVDDDRFELAYGYQVDQVPGYPDVTTYITGTHFADEGVGRTTMQWALEVVDGQYVRVTRHTPPLVSELVPYTIEDGLSSLIPLTGTGLLFRFHEAIAGTSWIIYSRAKPTQDISDVLRSMAGVMGVGNIEGFLTSPDEPWATFRNLWNDSDLFAYQYGGMLMALIYYMDGLPQADPATCSTGEPPEPEPRCPDPVTATTGLLPFGGTQPPAFAATIAGVTFNNENAAWQWDSPDPISGPSIPYPDSSLGGNGWKGHFDTQFQGQCAGDRLATRPVPDNGNYPNNPTYVSIGGDTARNSISAGWGGYGIRNVQGQNDLALFENGSGPPSGEEGFAIAVHHQESNSWSNLLFSAPAGFETVAYAYLYDFTDFGIPVGDHVDAIVFQNLVRGDRTSCDEVDETESYGFLLTLGTGTGDIYIQGLTGAPFSDSKLDPDVNYAVALSPLDGLPSSSSSSSSSEGPPIISLIDNGGTWAFTLHEELEFTQSGTSADAYGMALEGWASVSDGADNGISLEPGAPLQATLNGGPVTFNHMPLIADNESEPNYPPIPTTTFYFSVDRQGFPTAAIFAYVGDPPPNGGHQYLTGYEKFNSNDGDVIAFGPGSWDCPGDANPGIAGWNPECVGVFRGEVYLIDADGNQISNRVTV